MFFEGENKAEFGGDDRFNDQAGAEGEVIDEVEVGRIGHEQG